MVETAQHNLPGDIHNLPFPNESFDCVLNTMAFSGYPYGARALPEIRRVLKPAGRLVLMDVAYPAEDRLVGAFLANLWKLSGDLIRDFPSLLEALDFEFTEEEIRGLGSIHLYLAHETAG